MPDLNLDGASIEYAVPMPVQVDEAIDRGDMVWWDNANTTIKRASNFTWDTSGPITRRQFKRKFVGISMEYHRSGDAKGTMMVAVLATIEVKTISRAFVFGETLGPDDASSKLLDQTLERQQDPSECIADAIMDHTTAVTTTKVIIRGNLVGIAARATNEKRTIIIPVESPAMGTSGDLMTALTAEQFFGGPVEVLAQHFVKTIAVTDGSAILNLENGTTNLGTVTVTVAGSIGGVFTDDLSADAARFFDADDTISLETDGGSTLGGGFLIIEYRPL